MCVHDLSIGLFLFLFQNEVVFCCRFSPSDWLAYLICFSQMKLCNHRSVLLEQILRDWLVAYYRRGHSLVESQAFSLPLLQIDDTDCVNTMPIMTIAKRVFVCFLICF